MTRFGRVPRRPDHWSSPHERARFRAAERIDTTLDPVEAGWLDGHLADCADCRAVATAYEVDRAALRSLRDVTPEPPRDLWARTSAGIEREAARRGRPFGRGTAVPSGRSRLPVGAMAGIVVVVIVVGATALSGGWLDRPVLPVASPGSALAVPGSAGPATAPAATPFSVAAGSVGWVHSLEDGDYAYNVSPVDKVCPVDDRPGCASLDNSSAKRLTIATPPRTIIGSPTDGQAVVVGSDGAGGDQVLVMSLPKNTDATPAPTPEATPTETPAPTASPEPTETATPSAAPSDTPPAESATVEASTGPSEATTPSVEPSPSPETATPEPTPTETPAPTPTETALVTASPQATAKTIAIASGVTVVGQSAAFTADGTWFAFTARPSDDSAGPDIYVWHVGDEKAHRLTSDGQSVFASWSGDRVVGSRLVADDVVDEEYGSTSFLADPASGKETGDPIDLWRPVVDPTDKFAVAWSGTVLTDTPGTLQQPGRGDLILTSWNADATTSATRSKIPGSEKGIIDFDVRWDETGSWLAIWTAEATDPSIGRLSLFRLDRGSGALERPKGAPTDVPALPGFSIGDGRLAWVTPHGQDAEGSKVQVVAWSGDGVGAVESVPGDDVIVVR